jgi:hypothetical protein
MNNNKLIYGFALLLLAAVIFYIGYDLSSGSLFRKGKNKSSITVADSLSIPSVQSLITDCNCDIELIESDEEKVIFIYDKSEHINKTDFSNNTLNINFESKESNFLSFNHSSTVQAKVYCKGLKSINQQGVGDLTNKGIFRSTDLTILNDGVGDINLNILSTMLTITNNGVGDIELTGNAESSTLTNDGTGDINAKKLTSKNATVINDGVGDIDVQASDTLRLTNSGVGDINYSGTAILASIQSDGVGEINKK